MSSSESIADPGDDKQTVNLVEEFEFNECRICIPNDIDLELIDKDDDNSWRVNYRGREFIICKPLKNFNMEDMTAQLRDPLMFEIIGRKVIGVKDALTMTGITTWSRAKGWTCEVEFEGLLVNIPHDKFLIDLGSEAKAKHHGRFRIK